MNHLVAFLDACAARAADFSLPMLWQSTLLIALVTTMDFLFQRKLRPSFRCGLWLLVLLKLVLPPSFALPTSPAWWCLRLPPPAPTGHRTLLVTYDPVPQPAAPVHTVATAAPETRLTGAAQLLLASGSVSLLLLCFAGYRWFEVTREVRRSQPASPLLESILASAREQARVRRRIRLRSTERSLSPAVYGLFRPTVLLPKAIEAGLSQNRLRAVLVHELIHVRRGDVWVNCLQSLLQIAWWWHPLLWAANARIRRLREEAVDDAVMESLQADAQDYPPTLVEVARLALERPVASLGLVGILEPGTALRQRVVRLVDGGVARKIPAGLAALAIATFAAAALPMAGGPSADPLQPALSPDSRLVIRTFLVDVPSLQQRITAARPLSPDDYRQELLNLFAGAGVDLTPPRVLQFNANNGTLVIRATRSEIEKLTAMLTNGLATQTIGVLPRLAASAMPASSTNIVTTDPARAATLHKLLTLRLPHVDYNGLLLPEVLRRLDADIRAADPEGAGVPLLLDPKSEVTSEATTIEPASGLRAKSQVTAIDPNTIRIRVDRTLENPRLVDVLDAIVAGASGPLRYSIPRSGAIVFSLQPASQTPEFHVRAFKVDPDVFLANVREERRLSSDASDPDYARVLADLFSNSGIDWKPPSSVFYSRAQGTLLVRATAEDLDAIEAIVQSLGYEPQRIDVRVQFVQVADTGMPITIPQWLEQHGAISLTNSPEYFTGILSPERARTLRTFFEHHETAQIVGEGRITTFTGRQVQIQPCSTLFVITNFNALPSSDARPAPDQLNKPLPRTRTIPLGPMINIIPYANGESRTVRMVLIPSWVEFAGYEEVPRVAADSVDAVVQPELVPMPRFHVYQISTDVTANDGQTIVIAGLKSRLATTQSGPAANLAAEAASTNQIIVLVTPTLIDATGNAIANAKRAPAPRADILTLPH